MNSEDNRIFMSRDYSKFDVLKFDVLKTSIFALEASLQVEAFVLRTSKFPRGHYQPIVPEQKYSVV